MNIGKLHHKQECADRLQAIVREQINCGRQIQTCGYIPTPAMKEKMDRLIAEYDVAMSAYEKACSECDTPVYVTPIV
jgi:hypothetical protein